MKKEIKISIRKGLNTELDPNIQPGGYEEIDMFEIIIDGEVEVLSELNTISVTILHELTDVVNRYKVTHLEL